MERCQTVSGDAARYRRSSISRRAVVLCSAGVSGKGKCTLGERIERNSLLEIYSGPASHQLSATALLGSPDGSRHPLDVCEFTEEDYHHRNSNGNGHYQNGRSGTGLWECLIGCRRRLDQHMARRRVKNSIAVSSI